MPLDCFVRVWVVTVDEGHRKFWPCGVVAIADGVNEGFFWWEYRGCMVPQECFAGAGEIKNNVDCFMWCCLAFVLGRDVSGLRSSVHIPVCSQHSDSRTGGLVAVIFVVSSS